ncbi:hypothetical protein WJX72_010134 [[Myrmecia] bisecta]|uniref:Calponin-homology (CH) domain-containing protein n=1 Tax=[Myrmecia] bisecta TaxID=41462 RepID=A0AAW1QSF8_9CHLO
MAGLLRQWLHDDVGLKGSLSNIEQTFSSGYALGELLHKCNMQPDFDKFDARGNAQASFTNYSLLQPTFAKLGIPFTSRTANALLREERGVAAQLLYRVKTAVEAAAADVGAKKGAPRSTRLASTFGVSTTPSRGMVESQTFKSSRQGLELKAQQAYRDELKASQGKQSTVLERMRLQRFTNEGARQAADVAQYTEDKQLAEQAEKAALREGLLGQMSASAKASRDRTQKLADAHAATMARKAQLDKQDLKVELTLDALRKQRGREKVVQASTEVAKGIDAFESNLRRLASSNDGEADDFALPSGTTPLEHLQKLRASAPAAADLLRGSEGYQTTIKARRKEDVMARKEREARRRKAVVEQLQQQQESERAAGMDLTLAALVREGKQEAALAESIGQLRAEAAVMRANRELREQQYAQQREAEWEESLRREAEMHRRLKGEHDAATADEMARWREAQHAQRLAKAQRHQELAAEVAWQMVGVAEKAAEYREQADLGKVPRPVWRQWATMFVAGAPELTLQRPASDLAKEASAAADITPLDKATLKDYVAWSGDWQLSSSDNTAVAGANPALVAVVTDLAAIANAEPAPKTAAAALKYPLMLSVVGAPFSGKSTTARKLAEQHCLKVLEPNALIQSAIAESNAYIPPTPAPQEEAASQPSAAPAANPTESTPEDGLAGADATVAPAQPTAGEGADAAEAAASVAAVEEPERVILGRSAKAALQAGGQVPDDVLARLVVLAIAEVRNMAPEVAPADKAGAGKKGTKAKAKGKPSEEEAPKSPQGFVLDGYPRSAGQAQLLEKALTGLDLAREQAIRDSASVLAPPPPEVLANLDRPLTSGLDSVLVLSVSEEAGSVKRALGRRVDPMTGHAYHLDFDPPPANDPGLTERLKMADEDALNAAQIQARLAAHAVEAAPLQAWLARFQSLCKPVSADGAIDEVAAQASAVAAAITQAKKAGAIQQATADAAQQAAAAAETARARAADARTAAETAAKELLAAKRAEIEAAALLNANAKDADPAATEILKAAAAEKCAAQLKLGRAAAAEAAASAEAASKAAAEAGAAAGRMQENASTASLEASAEAMATATAAADQAKQAGEAAAKAAQRACEARDNATAAVNTAEQKAAEAVLPLAPTGKGGKAAAPAVDLSFTPANEGASGHSQQPPGPLQPLPLPSSLGALLHRQWQAVEATYMEGLSPLFAALRAEHAALPQYFTDVRAAFLAHMRRPAPDKQTLVDKFQQAFGNIDADLRGAPETKAELLLRCNELRDALWELCDARLQANEHQAAKIRDDSYVRDHTRATATSLSAMVQLEVDRFNATCALLATVARARYGLPAIPFPATAALDVLAAEPAEPIRAKFDKKTAMVFPDWVAGCEKTLPKLAQALKFSLAATAVVEEELGRLKGDEPSKDAKGGKAAAKPRKDAKAESGGEEGAREDPRAVEATAVSIVEGCRREVDLLKARMQLLAERAMAHVTLMEEIAGKANARIAEWLKQRYHGECSAVSALHKVASEAAFRGKPLLAKLHIEGGDLIVDEEPEPAPLHQPSNPNPPGSPQSWKVAQLGALADAFAAIAPGGYPAVADAAEVLVRLANQNSGPGLPEGWKDAPLVEAKGRCMDWMRLLLHLCVDRDPSAGVAKAVAAITGSADCKAQVNTAQLARIACQALPDERQGAVTADAIQPVLAHAFAARCGAASEDANTGPALGIDKLESFEASRQLLQEIAYAYKLHDVYTATRV